MFPVLMFSAVLALPPADGVEPSSQPAVAEKAGSPIRLDEVKRAYEEALQKSARRAMPRVPEVVPPLIKVYVQLVEVEGLSHAERSRMQSSVKARLEELRDKLIRELLRNKKLADRRKGESGRVRTSEPVDEKAQMLAGGGANAQAIQLIDLIQTTIAPESWQRNGGQGSISYFDLLKVLVVRQTGEVHHQLGGTLQQLRP